ncbi:LacI family DNA-binding transcriptional regulator [Micromonospora sp. NPDC018662]|uniref:LacI family DNA-binding transcriptional regulator n=1 Tax=Micromonospora sp. NPDC018662 TaxID=3364238 RepID=UPI0037A2B14E
MVPGVPDRGADRRRRRPTLAMVAVRAGVSTQTVSNAINAPQRVAPETLDRVLAVVRELRYRPHRGARAMRASAARSVAVRLKAVPDGLNGPIFDRFLQELCARLKAFRYTVRLVTAPWGVEEVEAYEDLFVEAAIDAVVLMEARLDDFRPAMLRSAGVPFVMFGRPWGAPDDETFPWVDVDGALGLELAVEHCVDRGYRDIAFLGWAAGAMSDERRAGWLRALRRRALPPLVAIQEGPDSVDNGRALAERVLRRPRHPQRRLALVCASDAMAIGAVAAVRRAGLTVGRDVGVTGFDDVPAAALVDPPLTTVYQPVEQCGALVVGRLLAELDGADAAPSAGLLAPRLVPRRTT